MRHARFPRRDARGARSTARLGRELPQARHATRLLGVVAAAGAAADDKRAALARALVAAAHGAVGRDAALDPDADPGVFPGVPVPAAARLAVPRGQDEAGADKID